MKCAVSQEERFLHLSAISCSLTTHLSAHYTSLLTIHLCSLYISAHYTSLLTIHLCSLYISAHYTSLLTIHLCSLYISAHYTSLLTIHLIPSAHYYMHIKFGMLYIPDTHCVPSNVEEIGKQNELQCCRGITTTLNSS